MQMMNFHKVKTQDRMKFELQIPFIVIEASYNSDKKKQNETSFSFYRRQKRDETKAWFFQ